MDLRRGLRVAGDQNIDLRAGIYFVRISTYSAFSESTGLPEAAL
ncbi:MULTISPECIES: hypothetical protein [Parabacteroides]|nr:hypothetical protein [Parabacteroides chongii]WFE86659.1 hypothetical protein P3L47_08765 [Parabacteroides chongii]